MYFQEYQENIKKYYINFHANNIILKNSCFAGFLAHRNLVQTFQNLI